jgi:polyisoprenoid-binding protein YceI
VVTPTLQREEPAAGAAPAQATATPTVTTWRIDPTHSSVGFSVKHMVFATVHGKFDGFRGIIRFDADRPWDASATAEIDAATIETGIRKRDDHLRSADFFDVATWPTIAYQSTRIRPAIPGGRNRWVVFGELTMHGVTRPVELAVEQIGAPGQRSANIIEFTATATISRKDFGMAFYRPIESGELVVGNDVTISITVQANRITS